MQNNHYISNKLVDIINEILNSEYIYEELCKHELQSLGMDSLLFIRLLVQIESEFDILIDDEDLINPILKNFNTLHDYVLDKVKGGKNDECSETSPFEK
jgi:acyl carrier protein